MVKRQIANILEMANRRAKRVKFGTQARVQVEHIWVDLELFKVIWGSLGALAIFPKMRFKKKLLLVHL